MPRKVLYKRVNQESENRNLAQLSEQLQEDPVLKELWDNKKDANYGNYKPRREDF